MSYDQKCYDLAEAFLGDIQNPVKHGDADALAQEIQTVIEDYLQQIEERDAEPPAAPEPEPASFVKQERDAYGEYLVQQAKFWDGFFTDMLSPKAR